MQSTNTILNKRPPPLIEQVNSLDLSDGNQAFASITDATVGITDTWSIMVWAKNFSLDSEVFSKGLFALNTRTGNTANQITMEGEGGGTFRNKNLRVRVYKSNGQFAQLRTWNDVMAGDTDTWVQYVLTWGGASGTGASGLKLYTQGVDRGVSTTTTVDNDSTLVTDTARGVNLGIAGTLVAGASPFWNGRIYSAAVYNSILSASEITAIYNAGNAVAFDLELDHDGYTSSGNLLHYMRVGLGSNELEMGTDHAAVTNDLSMDSRDTIPVGSQPITAADLNADVPDGL